MTTKSVIIMAADHQCTECLINVEEEGDDETVSCTLCQNVMHIACFLKGTTLADTSKRGRALAGLMETVKAAISSQCVLVVCDNCKTTSDIKKALKKLYDSSARNAIRMQELDETIETLTGQVENLKAAGPGGVMDADIEEMRKEVKEVLESAKKAARVVEDTDTMAVKERMEATWSEVIRKKRPEVLPMASIFREQLEQKRLTEENKSNLIIHALKPVEGVEDINRFLEIVATCGLHNEILSDDVLECKRLGAKKDGVIQPLKVVLSDVEKKKALFRKLGMWRAKLEADKDHDPNEKFPHIDHDLTREQRAERKNLVDIAKAKQAELPDGSPFRVRVKGAPDQRKVVKIDAKGKWTVLDISLMA